MFTIEKYPKITRGSRDIRTKNASYWIVKDYISKIKFIIDNAENKKTQNKLIDQMLKSDVYLLLKVKGNVIHGYVLYSDFVKKHYRDKKFEYIETPDKYNYRSILIEALPKKYTRYSQMTNQSQVEDFLYIHANKDIEIYNQEKEIESKSKGNSISEYVKNIKSEDLEIVYGNTILPTFDIVSGDLKINFTYDSNNLTNVYFKYTIYFKNEKISKIKYADIVSKYFDDILGIAYLNIRKLIIVYKVKQNKYDLTDLLDNWYPKFNIK